MKKIILFLIFFAIPFLSYGQFQTLPPPWDTSMVVRVDNDGDTLMVNGTLGVTGTFWQATQPVSGTFWQTTQSVSGTFWQATQPVSGTFWQATQPISINQTTTNNDVDVATIAVGDNNIGNVDVVTMPTVTVNTHAVTNAGTFVVQENGSALTALQLIDNAVSGAGYNITQLGGAAVPIGAGLEATAVRVTLPTDGTGLVTAKQATAANLNMTEASASAIKTAVELIDNCISGNEAQVDVLTMPTVTVNTHAITVASGGIASGAVASGAVASGAIASGAFASGSISAGAVVAGAASFVKLEDVGSANADAGVPLMAIQKANPANTGETDGDYTMLQMSNGRLWTLAILGANSGIDIGDVDVTSIANVTMSNAAMQMTGDEAHDAADAGNPVKIGAKAETSPRGITIVADGDRTDLLADADGMQMVKLNTSGADLLSERTTNTDGASTASGVFTAVASTYNYVTAISVYNSSATAGYIDFRDGTAGTIKWTMPLPAGGGAVLSSAVPLFKTSVNTALAYDVSGALSTIYISVSGYQGKL